MEDTKVEMFDEATVKFNPVFIDSLPFSLLSYAGRIAREFHISINSNEDLAYYCAGSVKLIANFIDAFPTFLSTVRKEVFDNAQKEKLEKVKNSVDNCGMLPVDVNCPLCEFHTNIKKKYTKHISLHKTLNKVDKKDGQVLFKCNACFEQKFSTKYLHCYLRHIESVHQVRKPNLCEICGMSFTRADNLTSHINSVHNDNPEARKYQCPLCQKAFRTKPHLTDHMTVHVETKDFVCDLCDRSFKSQKSLKRHMEYKHKNPRSFQCEKCDAAFNIRQSLQIHMKRVHMDKAEKEKQTAKVMAEKLTALITADLNEMCQDRTEDQQEEQTPLNCSDENQDNAQSSSTVQCMEQTSPPACEVQPTCSDTEGMSRTQSYSNLNSVPTTPLSVIKGSSVDMPDALSILNDNSISTVDAIPHLPESAETQSIKHYSNPSSAATIYHHNPSPAGSTISVETRQNDGFAGSRNHSYNDFQQLQAATQEKGFLADIVEQKSPDLPREDDETELDELLRMSSNDPPSGPQSIVSQLSRPPSASSISFHALSTQQPVAEKAPPSYEQSVDHLKRQGSYSHSNTSVFQPVIISSGVLTSFDNSSESLTHSKSAPGPVLLHTSSSTCNQPIESFNQFNTSTNSSTFHDLLEHSNTGTYNSTPQYSHTYNELECITTQLGNPVIVTDVIYDRATPSLLSTLSNIGDQEPASESRLLATNVEAINQLHTPTKEFPTSCAAFPVATQDDSFNPDSLAHPMFSGCSN